MSSHRVRRLAELGQSAWLDFLDRDIVASGELARMVAEDGLRGVTSNPTIFEKAIAGTNAYDHLIRSASSERDDASVLTEIMTSEVRRACDVLRPIYDASGGEDGFVSIEVPPTAAGDAGVTVESASALWDVVARPNLMVKIPATRAGLPAIESCLAHGINVNVTLLFGIGRYREVLLAHVRGLERRVSSGKAVERVASVASFFVSRIDTKVDRALDALGTAEARALRGRIAIANAKVAFDEQERALASSRWSILADAGARPQRLLWASTSTKDPSYPPLRYVEALVGPGTVVTMPRATFSEYLAHGEPELRLARGHDEARAELDALAKLGVDLDRVTDALETEGVAAFTKSYEATLASIRKKRGAIPQVVSCSDARSARPASRTS